jgi:hypothetical protein
MKILGGGCVNLRVWSVAVSAGGAPQVAEIKPTIPNMAPAPSSVPEKMAWISGGVFSIGREDLYGVNESLFLTMLDVPSNLNGLHRCKLFTIKDN